MTEQEAPTIALVEEMKAALHGVDKFLAMVINEEQLSADAVQKGNSLRAMVAKTLEKANSVGRKVSVASAKQTPLPSLPPKPGTGALTALKENSTGSFEQEEYTDMEPEHRQRIDTSASLYLDMNRENVEQDELYSSMASPCEANPGPPTVGEEPIDEEFYTDMATTTANMSTPPARSSNGAVEDPIITQEEYTTMDEALATPQPISPTLPSNTSSSQLDKKRASTMPAELAHEDGGNDLDQYGYGIGLSEKPIAAPSIIDTAAQHGTLEKLGGAAGKSWQKRYVILHDVTLYFYGSAKDKRQRNQIALVGYNVSEATEHSTKKKPAFKLTVPAQLQNKNKKKKMYCFRTNSSEERARWIGNLRAALMSANRRSKSFLDPVSADDNIEPPAMPDSNKDSENIVEDGFYEDPTSTTSSNQVTALAPAEDEYLVPAEQRSSGSGSVSGVSLQAQDDYLNPEDFARPPSTFSPYAPRPVIPKKEAPPLQTQSSNPYASRQQAMSDYMSRKQLEGLPPIPAPVAPVAPTSKDYVDTMSIFVQKADKPSYESIYVALWDYRAGADDELSFKRGDLIFIEDRLNDIDWWVGVKKQESDLEDFTGDRGLLVSAYVSPAYTKLS